MCIQTEASNLTRDHPQYAQTHPEMRQRRPSGRQAQRSAAAFSIEKVRESVERLCVSIRAQVGLRSWRRLNSCDPSQGRIVPARVLAASVAACSAKNPPCPPCICECSGTWRGHGSPAAHHVWRYTRAIYLSRDASGSITQGRGRAPASISGGGC